MNTLQVSKSDLKTLNPLRLCLIWDQWFVIDSGDSSDTCSSYNPIIALVLAAHEVVALSVFGDSIYYYNLLFV